MGLFGYLNSLVVSIWKEFIEALKFKPEIYLKSIGPASHTLENLDEEFSHGGSAGSEDISSIDDYADHRAHDIDEETPNIQGGDTYLKEEIRVQEFEGLEEFDRILQNLREDPLFTPTRSINSADSTIYDYGGIRLDTYDLYTFVCLILVCFAFVSLFFRARKAVSFDSEIGKSSLAAPDKAVDVSIESEDWLLDKGQLTPLNESPQGITTACLDEVHPPLGYSLPLNPPAYDKNLESSPLNLSFLSDDLESSDLGLNEDEQYLIAPFTLDSANEVGLSAIGGNPNLSISIKNSKSTRRSEKQPSDSKVKIGIKIKKNLTNPIEEFTSKPFRTLSSKEPTTNKLNCDIKIPYAFSPGNFFNNVVLAPLFPNADFRPQSKRQSFSRSSSISSKSSDIEAQLHELNMNNAKASQAVDVTDEFLNVETLEGVAYQGASRRTVQDDGSQRIYTELPIIDENSVLLSSQPGPQLAQVPIMTTTHIIRPTPQMQLSNDALETIAEEKEEEVALLEAGYVVNSQQDLSQANFTYSESEHIEVKSAEDAESSSPAIIDQNGKGDSSSKVVVKSPVESLTSDSGFLGDIESFSVLPSPCTPENNALRKSTERVKSNEKGQSADPFDTLLSPSKIPVISSIESRKGSPFSSIRSSPRAKTPTELVEIDERALRFLESKDINEERFLTDLFGEDPKIQIQEEFIDSLDKTHINGILNIYKGKESSENWKERFDNFDILIGHVRSHLPQEHYVYFQELIFESLDDILDLVSTHRSMLLNKVIIFLRDLVYYGIFMTDDIFIRLLHSLIPLTRTSQTLRHVSNLTFKSLCLMVQAIEPESFIKKFDSMFDKFIQDKKLKGEKYTCLFMVKFYLISNVDKFKPAVDDDDPSEVDVIASKLKKYVADLSIDGYQKTRSETLQIYLLLLRISPDSEHLLDFYNSLSTFLRGKVPKPAGGVNVLRG